MLFSIALCKISQLFEHSVGRVTRRDASSCPSSGWRIAHTHVTAPAGTPGILKHVITKKIYNFIRKALNGYRSKAGFMRSWRGILEHWYPIGMGGGGMNVVDILLGVSDALSYVVRLIGHNRVNCPCKAEEGKNNPAGLIRPMEKCRFN
jgi:hypothetical protein